MGLDNLDIFDEGESEEPIELQPEVQVQQCAPQEQLVAQPNKGCQYVAVKGHSRNVRKGKALGVNPRGSFAERRAWNLHMQVKKAQKRMLVCETDALEMLHSLQTRSRERVQIQKGKKGNLFVATTGFARGSKSPCPVCRRRGVGAGESYNSTVFVQFYCNV